MNYVNIPNAEFKSKINEADTVILDVRTASEFEEGFIPHARNIDILGGEFVDELAKLDKSKTYLVYCRSGNRSGSACSVMSANGFSKVYNLAGGIMFWDGPINRNLKTTNYGNDYNQLESLESATVGSGIVYSGVCRL